MEGRPPKTVDVPDEKDGACRYCLAQWPQEGMTAAYTFSTPFKSAQPSLPPHWRGMIRSTAVPRIRRSDTGLQGDGLSRDPRAAQAVARDRWPPPVFRVWPTGFCSAKGRHRLVLRLAPNFGGQGAAGVREREQLRIGRKALDPTAYCQCLNIIRNRHI